MHGIYKKNVIEIVQLLDTISLSFIPFSHFNH